MRDGREWFTRLRQEKRLTAWTFQAVDEEARVHAD